MKTQILNSYDAVMEYLNELSNSDLVSIHNEYCQSIGDGDSEIYDNDEEFFNTFFDGKVMEAVRAISFGEYQYNDNYVTFNGYANLESFDDPEDHIDLSSIANDILENCENYYDIELEEPDEEEDEEEDEDSEDEDSEDED